MTKGPIRHSLKSKRRRGAVLSRLALAECDPYPKACCERAGQSRYRERRSPPRRRPLNVDPLILRRAICGLSTAGSADETGVSESRDSSQASPKRIISLNQTCVNGMII